MQHFTLHRRPSILARRSSEETRVVSRWLQVPPQGPRLCHARARARSVHARHRHPTPPQLSADGNRLTLTDPKQFGKPKSSSTIRIQDVHEAAHGWGAAQLGKQHPRALCFSVEVKARRSPPLPRAARLQARSPAPVPTSSSGAGGAPARGVPRVRRLGRRRPQAAALRVRLAPAHPAPARPRRLFVAVRAPGARKREARRATRESTARHF